jgi:hypothetical protein
VETAQDRAMPTPPNSVYSKKTVRLPENLWSKAQAEADLNGRSLNAELTARLIDAYARPNLVDIEQKQDEATRLIRQVLAEVEALIIRGK